MDNRFMTHREKEMSNLRKLSESYISGWVNNPEIRRKKTQTDEAITGICEELKEKRNKKRP